MKLLNSILCFIALAMAQPLSARAMPNRPAAGRPAQAQQQPIVKAPNPVVQQQQTAGTFQNLIQEIRTKKSEDVIADDGIFTNTFEDMIRSSDLPPIEMKALLEAGRSLHLPLSGNNQQDIDVALYAGREINNIISSLGAIPNPAPQAPAIPRAPSSPKPVTDAQPQVKTQTPQLQQPPIGKIPAPIKPVEQEAVFARPESPAPWMNTPTTFKDIVTQKLMEISEKYPLENSLTQSNMGNTWYMDIFAPHGKKESETNKLAQKIIDELMRSLKNIYPQYASSQDRGTNINIVAKAIELALEEIVLQKYGKVFNDEEMAIANYLDVSGLF